MEIWSGCGNSKSRVRVLRGGGRGMVEVREAARGRGDEGNGMVGGERANVRRAGGTRRRGLTCA